jgi:hypothetical protein
MPRLLAVLCAVPGLLAAQAAPAPPRAVVLDWAASPIDLTGPARAGGYVSAVGRRAVALGSETGSFEVWAWPLKLLYGFELASRPRCTTSLSRAATSPGRSASAPPG